MPERHLLITGLPGCGKTTLIERLAENLVDWHPAGFVTREIREQGVRRGFRLIGLEGREGVLSHVRFKGGPRVSRYGVDVAGFEEFLATLDLERSEAPLILIDEIGKMECFSSRFVVLMRKLLDSDRIVVATIAAKGGGFIAEVKQRPDCQLLELRPDSREALFRLLLVRLRRVFG